MVLWYNGFIFLVPNTFIKLNEAPFKQAVQGRIVACWLHLTSLLKVFCLDYRHKFRGWKSHQGNRKHLLLYCLL